MPNIASWQPSPKNGNKIIYALPHAGARGTKVRVFFNTLALHIYSLHKVNIQGQVYILEKGSINKKEQNANAM